MLWSNVYNNRGIIFFCVPEHGSCHTLLHMNPAFVLHFLKTFLITGWSCQHEILIASLQKLSVNSCKERGFYFLLSYSVNTSNNDVRINFCKTTTREAECQLSSQVHIFICTRTQMCLSVCMILAVHGGICRILTLIGVFNICGSNHHAL